MGPVILIRYRLTSVTLGSVIARFNWMICKDIDRLAVAWKRAHLLDTFWPCFLFQFFFLCVFSFSSFLFFSFLFFSFLQWASSNFIPFDFSQLFCSDAFSLVSKSGSQFKLSPKRRLFRPLFGLVFFLYPHLAPNW